MKKIKLVTILTIIISLFIVLTSCSDKYVSLNEYSDVYTSINDETQKEIEASYKAKYGKDIKWCAPIYNISSFDSI